MTNKLKPRRMGVTRKMAGLPTVPKQEASLVDADCYPVFDWVEFPKVIPSFLEDDVVVAVSSAVFGAKQYPFITEGLSDELPKAKPGPKPTLDKCNPDQMVAIEYLVEKFGYPAAVEYCAEKLGIKTDRHALYYKLKRAKNAEKRKAVREQN